MKALTESDKANLYEIHENVGKTLIKVMDILEIPNFLEVSYICDGYKYKLRFDKEKIVDSEWQGIRKI